MPGSPTGVSEIVRIRPNGAQEVAVNGLGYLLREPWILLQSHRGDLYGLGQERGYDYSVFQWPLAGQPSVNLGPYAQPDFARPPAPGTSRTLRVLNNDRDVNGDPLTITAVGTPRLGTATLAPSGREILYTAPAGEPVNVDEFTYTISDGHGARGIGRVTLRANARGNFTAQIPNEDPRYEGHLSVRLSGYGALTGKLWLGGLSWTFAGTLDANDRFAITLGNWAVSPELSLQVKARGADVFIEATTVVNGVSQVQVLTAPNLKKAGAAAGAYTFVIPAKAGWPNLPRIFSQVHGQMIDNPLQQVQGAGFGRWTVLRSGAAIVTGRMPDGEPFAATNWMDDTGRLQLFASLYPTLNTAGYMMRGWVRGAVNFRDIPGVSDADAQVKWIVTIPGIGTYAPPLEQEIVTLQASRYTPPGDLSDFFPGVLRAEASGGEIQGPIIGTARAVGNSLVSTPPLRLNGNFNRTTGLFSGHLSRPGSSNWVPWSGVLMQKQSSMFGQFREFGRHYFWQPRAGTGSLKFTPN
jgi:hypothetical protein